MPTTHHLLPFTRAIRSACCAAAMFALIGCSGAPMHRVELSVLGVHESGEAVAVRGARVTAAPLGLSPVPLPVSGESFTEQKLSTGDAAFTDSAGRVVFKLAQEHEYLIEVEAPIAGAWSGHEDARYLLDHSWTLRAADTSAASLDAWIVRLESVSGKRESDTPGG